MLDSFDLYSYTQYWRSENNILGTDFNLYSTFDDAVYDRNRWTFCDYDDMVGMFQNCGPSGKVESQWTSLKWGGVNAFLYIMGSGSSKLEKYWYR